VQLVLLESKTLYKGYSVLPSELKQQGIASVLTKIVATVYGSKKLEFQCMTDKTMTPISRQTNCIAKNPINHEAASNHIPKDMKQGQLVNV
jgi:hypothetical protein